MTAEVHDLTARRSIGKADALLCSLVPRAQCFCYYDLDRRNVWSSDAAEDHEVDQFVADLPPEIVDQPGQTDEVVHRTLSSGRTVLLLPVDDEGERLGLLVALFSKNAGKSSSFNPKLLKTVLEPALRLLADNLRADSRLAQAETMRRNVERELELVYEVDERIHGTKARHSGLAQLVGKSGRYLGINYSVLLIPSKRIRISATHSAWKGVNRKVLDRYLIEQLMPRLDGQRRPVVFEIPAVEGSDNIAEQGYQALLTPLFDRQNNIEGVLALLGRVDKTGFAGSDRRFMSHIVRKVEYVIEQSFDAMTGLMNRAGFEAQLHESRKALTSDHDEHQLIYFDLDNLQLINDNFGRKAGDDVILRFARLLDEDLPKTGVLSRLTGDDFCLLLTHVDAEAALAYAHRLRSQGESLRYLQGDKSLQVGMSIGIASFNRGNADSALTTARMACEAAKDHGRDRIEVYDDQNQSIVRRYDDMQLIAEIQQAIDGNAFELQAQPIMSLQDKTRGAAFEVLLRMDAAGGGRVQTKALFSAAERYRIMPQIDRWVLSRTLSKLVPAREYIDGLGVVFSINLSGQSLGDDDILEFIEDEIRASGLPPTCLCFEVTESAAVSNLEKAQKFIDRLREIGCSISLDDFGAGLSSFAYLKNFNVDTLKIDGGFIRDITENRISESMVAAITQVAKVMKLSTVAEYVETREAHDLLNELGVDFGQGHYIGRPISIDTVLDDLTDLTKSSTG